MDDAIRSLNTAQFAIAEACLPGAGLGGYALAGESRLVVNQVREAALKLEVTLRNFDARRRGRAETEGRNERANENRPARALAKSPVRRARASTQHRFNKEEPTP